MFSRIMRVAICLTCAATVGAAKDWKGIVPLKSTRVEVERLLGPNERGTVVSYKLKDSKVMVWYSTGACDSSSDGDWDVPKSTVTSVHVFSYKRVRLSSLSSDLSKFEKIHGDADLGDHFYYINKEEGFGIGLQNLQDGKGEVVTEYVYGPSSKDSSLKCLKSKDD